MRSGVLEREAFDPESRTIELSFASGTAIQREFGYEILSMKPGAVDFERLRSAGPLLMDHDWGKQIGKVTEAEIVKGKARAKVVFSRSAYAEEILQDVRDGIRTSTSVAYIISEMVKTGSRSKGLDEWTVSRWIPIEISLTSVPADTQVGTDRSGQTSFAVRTLVDNRPMNTDESDSDSGTAELPAVIG
jgi:hypothetical protein